MILRIDSTEIAPRQHRSTRRWNKALELEEKNEGWWIDVSARYVERFRNHWKLGRVVRN